MRKLSVVICGEDERDDLSDSLSKGAISLSTRNSTLLTTMSMALGLSSTRSFCHSNCVVIIGCEDTLDIEEIEEEFGHFKKILQYNEADLVMVVSGHPWSYALLNLFMPMINERLFVASAAAPHVIDRLKDMRYLEEVSNDETDED